MTASALPSSEIRDLPVLILIGEGKTAFIGGADIKEMGLIRDINSLKS
jgi:enoyl-CoA hydratase/carnithine racemase